MCFTTCCQMIDICCCSKFTYHISNMIANLHWQKSSCWQKNATIGKQWAKEKWSNMYHNWKGIFVPCIIIDDGYFSLNYWDKPPAKMHYLLSLSPKIFLAILSFMLKTSIYQWDWLKQRFGEIRGDSSTVDGYNNHHQHMVMYGGKSHSHHTSTVGIILCITRSSLS